MPTGIKSCPIPVVERIVECLDLDDIRNLRLSCATLATRASDGRFTRFFESRHVDLTADALRSLVRTTQIDSLAGKLQSLFLTGIMRGFGDRPLWLTDFICDAQTDYEIHLLRQAFNGLANCNRNGCILTLSLRVAPIKNGKRVLPRELGRGYPLKTLWQCITYTLNTTMRALAASELQIDRLIVFNDPDMQRCSLSCDKLNTINWGDASMIHSLAHLTTLSISLADRIFVFNEDEEIDEDFCDYEEEERNISDWQPSRKDTEILAASQDESNFSGLANLIASCPRLEDIELHYHSVAWSKTRLFNYFRREQILTHVAGLANLPLLKRCRLRGITARQVDLLRFLRKAKVAEVFIESIHLATGTLRPIIEYCVSESGYVRKLHIDTVYERCEEGYRGLVHFFGEGESRRYAGTFDVGTELLNREGDGRKTAVSYYVRRPIADATPAICAWTRRQREEYN